MPVRVVDIYEERDGREKRVVGHRFYGKTHKEAKHNERSHLKSDKFLKAALGSGKFKGIRLSVRRGRRK